MKKVLILMALVAIVVFTASVADARRIVSFDRIVERDENGNVTFYAEIPVSSIIVPDPPATARQVEAAVNKPIKKLEKRLFDEKKGAIPSIKKDIADIKKDVGDIKGGITTLTTLIESTKRSVDSLGRWLPFWGIIILLGILVLAFMSWRRNGAQPAPVQPAGGQGAQPAQPAPVRP